MKVVSKVKRRPAETAAGIVGTVSGLVLALLHASHVNLPSELVPYVPIVVGWLAGLVTWFKTRGKP